MPISFDAPALLLLALIALPLTIVAWRRLRNMDTTRRATIVALRAGLLITLAVVLAGPSFRREHDHLTVIGLLDISGSVQQFAELPSAAARRSYVSYLRSWFEEAISERNDNDRFGLVVFDGEAITMAAPSTTDPPDDALDISMLAGTDIEDAVRLGLALFPPDTARRLVLVSDGNETIGDARAAARAAAGNVPIDVLPITYRVDGDVQIERIEVPPSGRAGQVVTARIVLRATKATRGRLVLRQEGQPVDLAPGESGRARAVTVPKGVSVQLAQLRLGDSPVNRFEAEFEPDRRSDDVLADNNRAEAFTSTPGRGRVLIVDNAERTERTHPLARWFRAAELPVEVMGPDRVPVNLLTLQNYDLIVLDNVPAYRFTGEQQDRLGRYVHDLGGGLIMTGGRFGFGAGGWNGTPVEAVLPLELDPPPSYRLPRAALVLILDRSGSMARAVAGARASQQEVANEAAALAVASLRSESLVGIVAFESGARTLAPLALNRDPDATAARIRTIVPGGGTNLAPALQIAYDMLRNADADRKRVVVLTDGQSEGRDPLPIVEAMIAQEIRVSTIAVGDEADLELLQKIAEIGQGDCIPVINPKSLPRVLVDSVQSINTPLIKESRFRPVVLPTGSTITAGMSAAPELRGLVVTVPRPDGRGTIEMTHPDGEPLLAVGQAGLGRVAAFTSEVGGPWGDGWRAWPDTPRFWVQLARSVLRPPADPDAELLTQIVNDRLEVSLEATNDGRSFVDYLQVTGTVYTPDGTALPLRLRQVAPGRYEGSLPAREAGNYIVTLSPRRGERRLAPVIGGVSRLVGEEFRRYRSNLELLESIVTVTGGRRLDLAEPETAELYDRTDLPPSIAFLPIWRGLLLSALVLLLLDIADRRLAWTRDGVQAFVARLFGRIRPAEAAAAATETMAGLRAATQRVEQKVERTQRGVTKLKPPAPREPPIRRRTAEPAKPAPVDEKTVKETLQSLIGRGETKPAKPAAPAEAPPTTDEDADETRSSLLAAKRRARKRLDGDG